MENSQEERDIKQPEKKTGQFCCFEVLSFPPIEREYKIGDRTKYKNYHNVKFYYHSWYKKGSTKTYIIASNEFTLKSNELLEFLNSWQGSKIDRSLYELLDSEKLKSMAYGLNALIDYETGLGTTKIIRILPAPVNKSIVPIADLKVPEFLINRPIKKKASGVGFGSLLKPGNVTLALEADHV